MKNILILLTTTALLCGCNKPAPVQSETEKRAVEAHALVLAECTNEIVGLTKIISAGASPDTYNSTNIAAWSCWATVEYVNQTGGIDRTNLMLHFHWVTNQYSPDKFLVCEPDFDKIFAAHKAVYEDELKRAGELPGTTK